jgi:glycosyltransferase involved in cell wall biosynthesis
MSTLQEKKGISAATPEPQRGLKVCHVVGTAEGARWVVEQLRELRDRYGCEVMAVVGGEQGGLINQLREEKIPYHVEKFNFTSLRRLPTVPFIVWRLSRLFRRERVDVVQSHLFFSMVIARFAAWLAGVPVRLAMYAAPFHLEAPTSLWIDRATCWMESGLIPSCEQTVELCRAMGVAEDRLALIYYGPDERRFDPRMIAPAGIRASSGWSPDTPLIVKVAYFYPRLAKSNWVPPVVRGRGIKGHEDLVRAAPLILAKYPNAKFLLVGSGWDKNGEKHKLEIEELVRSLGLEESVIFPGYRRDANRILREADVAVQASLHDNPAGTIEALLLECPTVVTRVGGLVDTVRDGETGFQANPSDPQDLARCIIQMLGDRERARALGRAGRQLMLARFTLSRTVNDLCDVYSRLWVKQRRQSSNPLRFLVRGVVAASLGTYIIVRLLLMDILPTYPARFKRLWQRSTSHLRRLL